MRRLFPGGLALLLCTALGLAAPGDWPQWRGPHRDGVSTETGLLKEWPEGGPKLLWDSRKVNSGQGIGTGFSSVSIADGRVFTMGDQKGKEQVFSLDAKTGKNLWSTPICKAEGDGSRSTPTVDGNRVYAVSRQGDLVCLSVSDGRMVWQKNYGKDFGGRMMSGWHYSESVLVDGDKVICTPGGDMATLAALDKGTGKVIWKAAVPNGGGSGYASIVTADVGGIRQYITLLRNCIVGVAADDGRFLWRYNRAVNGTANIPTPIVWGDRIFFSTGYGAGSALLQLSRDGNDIKVKEVYYLRGNQLQNHHGGVVRLGEYLYGGHGHNDGQPFCFNLKTGKFAWGPVRGPGSGSAGVVYADGNLYFRYQDNVMALIEATPKGYHLRSQFHLPRSLHGNGWPHPVVAHGKLWIRGQDTLLCYDVKQ